MIKIDTELTPSHLSNKLRRFWQLSGEKIELIEKKYDSSKGSPVFTVEGNYTTRGWTEWTQGFQHGSAVLQFDVSGEDELLQRAKKKIVDVMAPHLATVGCMTTALIM